MNDYETRKQIQNCYDTNGNTDENVYKLRNHNNNNEI